MANSISVRETVTNEAVLKINQNPAAASRVIYNSKDQVDNDWMPISEYSECIWKLLNDESLNGLFTG